MSQIFEGDNEYNKYLLNLGELNVNTEYSKIGLVKKITTGINVNGKKYYKYTIVDRCGISVAGFFHNPNFEMVLEDEGKLFKIEFLFDRFNGNEIMSISSLTLFEQVMSVGEYFGNISNYDEEIKIFDEILNSSECLKKVAATIIPTELKKKSKEDCYGGKLGGYAKFINDGLKILNITTSELGSEEKETLTETWVLVNCFMSRHNSAETLGVEKAKGITEVCRSVEIICTGREIKNKEVVHTYLSIIGVEKPKTLIAKLVCETMNYMNNCQAKITFNNSLLKGSQREVDGEIYRKL